MTKLIGLASILTQAHAASREVRLRDCPVEVQATIADNSRGGKLDEVKLQLENRVPVYVAEIDYPKDREVDVFVSQEGHLLRTREDIRLIKVPPVVRETLLKLGGKIDDLEIERAGEKVTYRAEIDRKKMRDLDVVVSSSGELLSQEVESD